MRTSVLLLLLFFAGGRLFAQQMTYSEVRITTDRAGLAHLAGLGIAADEGYYKKGEYFHTVLSSEELKKVMEAGFPVEMIHRDYTKFI